ncbi:MAG: delta-60 repeat domain-containing protein, partial [Verrucomicrobiota bacterium JB023]|nr:delta-60 repeat domain-containing protein [Verrucomicrobiota bacterium JB023]
RLNADGSKDTSYDPGNTQYEDDVYGMVTDSQGRIYVYGEFRSYGGVLANGYIRLNPDGSHDPTFYSEEGFSNTFVSSNKHPIAHAAIDPAGGIYYISSETNSGFQQSRRTGLVRVFTDVEAPSSGFDTFVSSLPANEQGENDDPDRDNIPNLLEYLYNFDPAVTNAIELVQELGSQAGSALNTTYPGQGLDPAESYATFEVIWPLDLKDASLTLEVATNLQNFGTSGLTPVLLDTQAIDATSERRTYRLSQPLSTAPSAFLQLSASR